MSMIIKTKSRLAPSIGMMHEMVLRCIFDPDNFTFEERLVLEDGIKTWYKKVDLSLPDKWEIDRILNALIANEKGFFDRAKELIKEHNIDYRKMYKAGIPFVNPERKFWNKS